MNTRNNIFLIMVCFIVLMFCVDGYVISKNRVLKDNKPIVKEGNFLYKFGNKNIQINKSVSTSDLKLIQSLLNSDCRDIESAGIQAGCIIYRTKVLKMLGVQIDQNSITPSNPVPKEPNKICYPLVNNQYTQFPFNDSRTVLYDEYKEYKIWKNGTQYNMTKYNGLRVYIVKNELNRSAEEKETILFKDL